MKHLLSKVSITTAFALGLAATSFAGPLNTNRLPADTAWVIHLDLEQVRSTAMGQYLLSEEIGLEIDDMREDMKLEIGFDLFDEGMDLTLHGPRDDDKAGVVVLLATPAVDDILQWIKTNEPSYETMEVDGYSMHTWRDKEKDEQLYMQMKSIENNRRQVVLSSSLARLLLSLKTMENRAPDVTHSKDSGLAVAPPMGSLLYFQAAKMTCLPDVDIDDRVANAAGRVTFAMSEHSEMSRVELSCTADSNNQAATLSEIVQGAVALGKLITSSDDELEELHYVLSQTQSKAIGNEVSLRFEIPSEKLTKLAEDESKN